MIIKNEQVINKNTLVNADSYQYLKLLQDKSIDFVCIDPPYEFDNHGGGKEGKEMKRQLNDKHIDFISKGFDLDIIFSEIERVSKTMNLICFCSNKQISKIMSYWEEKKYSVTLLVWDKPNPIPFGNGKHIGNLEFMVYVRGKGATFNNIGVNEQKKSYIYPAPSSKQRIHPTEKPITILERLLKIHTKEDDLVLDCFAGSFSLASACKSLNRKSISIEIDETYFNNGVKRIENQLF